MTARTCSTGTRTHGQLQIARTPFGGRSLDALGIWKANHPVPTTDRDRWHMGQSSFLATAWNNGAWNRTGSGYGLKISVEDRDWYFQRCWNTVTLRLIGDRTSRTADANVAKSSFWDQTCRELITTEIGQWFIENGFGRWLRGTPPRFRIVPLAEHEFEARPYRS